ncbi:hypothetical protein Desde_0676 [Desulfitobacterium dehalogenans ATCC 51507]|uniref:Uncharacterized protein n=1 Tax=Desulfitobacterium dehalogenans (strain ATCC 51507 / DSM 9161 / JW/IU-DC1) TaxID=756499 RepID=I4A590_DESDJ|nr:hypothetical protein [Desulfitobacterium dehalogenans]AFL99124.1 hypothetical protein Desde_0676 [Desulfitobacterium dehalogenans ATCC 51507]
MYRNRLFRSSGYTGYQYSVGGYSGYGEVGLGTLLLTALVI